MTTMTDSRAVDVLERLRTRAAEWGDDTANVAALDRAIARLREPAEAQAQDIGPEWKPCRKRPVIVHVREQRPGEQHVSTREGITAVKPDDLIMRGVEGEEYPIGRELFAKTYDLVEAQAQGGGEAVQRVAAFVVEYQRRVSAQTRGGLHHDTIYTLGTSDATLELRVSDLAAMLASAPQPPAEAQAHPVEWVQEWQGSGPQRGYHIRDATRLHNNRVAAYLGDQVDSGEVDRLIAEHNGKHPNGEPLRPAEAQAQGGGEVVQRLRGVLQHAKMGNSYLISRDLIHKAIGAITAPPSAPDRDAYEGAREDLLDWKRRAQRAESTLRGLGYKGIDASEAPSAPVGVELPPAAERVSGTVLGAGFVQSGDWTIPTASGGARVFDERMAYGWNECRKAVQKSLAQQPAAYPDRIVLWSRGVAPHWYFVAKKADRPDMEGAPVYETLDEVVLRGSPEAQQPAAVDGVMAFTDAAVDAIQSRMADLGFVVPVRVISEGVSAALAAQHQEPTT